VKKHTDKRVTLEPYDEQKLRLERAHGRCVSNIEARWRLELEQQCYESQLQLYQLALEVAKEKKAQVEEQLAKAEREAQTLTEALVNLGEQIKLENSWGDHVQWDPVSLTFSAPAEGIPVVAVEVDSEPKVRIQ
jgi:hypothetical protein